MTILLLLVPISLVLLGIAIGVFVWAVRSGQFDELDTPALDVLREDPLPPAAQASSDAVQGPSDSATVSDYPVPSPKAEGIPGTPSPSSNPPVQSSAPRFLPDGATAPKRPMAASRADLPATDVPPPPDAMHPATGSGAAAEAANGAARALPHSAAGVPRADAPSTRDAAAGTARVAGDRD
jgi:cbb3-type cytochrome oxidase maturation protein